jgi:hypothetical protein
MRPGALFSAIAIAVTLPSSAGAQTGSTVEYDWTRRVTMNGFGGVASGASDPSAVFGAGVGWGIAPRWTLEGSGAWFAREAGAESFGASLTAQVSLGRRLPALPYLKAGIGMYLTSFDLSRTTPPEFYRRRIGPGGPATGPRHEFRDPSIVLGGGVNVLVGRRIGIRPEVETTVVVRGGHAHAVTAGLLRIAYHFETHQITPARRMPRE